MQRSLLCMGMAAILTGMAAILTGLVTSTVSILTIGPHIKFSFIVVGFGEKLHENVEIQVRLDEGQRMTLTFVRLWLPYVMHFFD